MSPASPEAPTAIERVFYAHRIWPGDNPGSRPPFEEAVPRTALATKVEDFPQELHPFRDQLEGRATLVRKAKGRAMKGRLHCPARIEYFNQNPRRALKLLTQPLKL